MQGYSDYPVIISGGARPIVAAVLGGGLPTGFLRRQFSPTETLFLSLSRFPVMILMDGDGDGLVMAAFSRAREEKGEVPLFFSCLRLAQNEGTQVLP